MPRKPDPVGPTLKIGRRYKFRHDEYRCAGNGTNKPIVIPAHDVFYVVTGEKQNEYEILYANGSPSTFGKTSPMHYGARRA